MRKIIFLILLIIALGFSLQVKSWVDSMVPKGTDASATSTPDTNVPDIGIVPVTATINGTFTCLPHAGNPEFVTLECAFGLKASDGRHYALDFSGTPNSAFDLPMDRQYMVTGLLTPIEMISAEDTRRKYDIVGIMKVSKYEEITKDIPTYNSNQLLTLELKKPVIVGDYKITVGAVLEDSRCPADAMCIQQGTVKVAITAENEDVIESQVLEIDQSMTVGSTTITLKSVDPYPLASVQREDSQLRFGIFVK